MARLQVTEDISIDEAELGERFIHASGPGGQNVNKVATAVQLRFDLARSPSLPEPVRRRAMALAGKRLTGAGVLLIEARRFRTQERNRADARARLVELIRRAAMPPAPRLPTLPTAAGERARLEAKKRRSAIKRARARPADD